MSMTDVSGAAGSANAGAPALPNGTGNDPNGSVADGAADPFAGLDAGTREWVGKKGYKSGADAAKAAFNAESQLGSSVRLPGKDAKPEDWDKFRSEIVAKLPADHRAPEKAEGYEFKLPDGIPAEMPYDADFASSFKPLAKEIGLSAKEAQKVHDFYVGKAADHFKAQMTEHGKKASDATEALEKAWGKSETDEFKGKVNSAFRAIKGLDGKDNGELMASLKDAGLLGELNGAAYVVSAPIAIALAKIGDALYREDNLVPGYGGAPSGANPFAGKNLTAQNLLWNQDQARAEAFIRAIGKTPKDFGYRA